MAEIREEGYYWCKVNGEWDIYKWESDYKWRLAGTSKRFTEDESDIINEERIPNPDEKLKA